MTKKTSQSQNRITRVSKNASTQSSTSKPQAKPQAEPKLQTSSEYPADPALSNHSFWNDIKDSLPPWMDEIIAISLIIVGLLSIVALLDSAQATVALAWANVITGLFGYGAILVGIGLLSFGLFLLLPKAGVYIRLTQTQLFSIEIAFLCVLAILHLASGETELRSVAREGQGGGLIGWGVSLPFFYILGHTLSIVIFALLFLICIAVIFGIGRQHIVMVLDRMSDGLENVKKTVLRSPFVLVDTLRVQQTPIEEVLSESKRNVPIMRIRPDIGRLPLNLRRNIQQYTPEKPAAKKSLYDDHPLFQQNDRNAKSDAGAIGEITDKKNKQGIPIVIRPDGREKLYFQSKKMKDDRKIARRSSELPDLDLLLETNMTVPDDVEINHNVVLIENTLLEFDVDIDIIDVQVGPTVTRYALQPYKITKDGREIFDRTRIRKILAYQNDLSLALSAKRLRIEAPVPGENYMGIEVPNKEPGIVSLKSVYESKEYYDESRKSKAPLLIPLGRDVAGKPFAINLSKMPHLLIAGTTGSGKSMCIASIATSLLLSNTPDQVKMVMIDPKRVELSRFDGIPHLLGPVETDVDRAVGVLKWCTHEMDRRYKLLEEHGARNISIYNENKGKRDFLPYMVILIDEIGDLMANSPDETEKNLTRLAQMARAVGMHMVVATQRPSVDVITGLIKANFPSRIAFAVASGVDSRVIIDSIGAENLIGNGDMLYQSQDVSAPQRIQGCYVSDPEVDAVLNHWYEWLDAHPRLQKEHEQTVPWEKGIQRKSFLSDTDPMLEEAIKVVVKEQEASASLLQRRLELGYPRAARIIDLMEELGIIGEPTDGGRTREVLVEPGENPMEIILQKRAEKPVE